VVLKCERMIDLDHRFPSFLDGTTKPANPAEGIDLAAATEALDLFFAGEEDVGLSDSLTLAVIG
jgi:hypothetical protein